METVTVGLFVKVPEPGSVKTRLGDDVGMKKAASFYAGCVGWLLQRLKESDHRPVVFYAPPSKKDRLQEMYSILSSVRVVPQDGKNLGQRMYNALSYLNREYDGHALLIGSDTPLLPFEHVRKAGRALNKNDLVLGPSADGGYYLVGTDNPPEGLFYDMEWSHEGVLEETLKRAREHSLNVEHLPEYNDIDTLEDLLGKVTR